MAQFFLEALIAATVRDGHARSILPDQDLSVVAHEEFGIGTH